MLKPTCRVEVTMADGARVAAFVFAPEGVADEPGTPFAVTWSPAPVLILHGNGESHEHMAGVIERLAGERSVIAIDSRGQGASVRGAESLTYELMAADTLEVMSRLGVTQAHVLGFSDGGIVGLMLARDVPWRVLSLTSIGANLTPEGLVPEALEGMRSALEGMELGRGVWYETVPDGGVVPCISEYDASGSEPICCEAAGEPARYGESELLRLMLEQPHIEASELGRIACLTYVLAGEHDLVRKVETEAIAAAIPGARLKFVSGAGHDLPMEAPYAVACAAREVMEAGEPARAERPLLTHVANKPQVRACSDDIEVRRATAEDEPRVLALYERVLDACELPGYDSSGWRRGSWPIPNDVSRRLRGGTTWVAVGHAGSQAAGPRILGAMSLDHDDDLPGTCPDWEELAEPQRLTCHLLAVDPEARGRGVATALLAAYAREALRRGCVALRINTNPQNLASNLYRELGFVLHKPVWFPYEGLDITNWTDVFELRLDRAAE